MTEKHRTCKICGRIVSPLMEDDCYHASICQSCKTLKEMERDGTLAKNGLSICDLM